MRNYGFLIETYTHAGIWGSLLLHHHIGEKFQMYKRDMNHREASKYLGISEAGLYGLVKKSQIPHTGRGKTLRYDRVRLDNWVEECHEKHGVTLEKAIENQIRKKFLQEKEWEY